MMADSKTMDVVPLKGSNYPTWSPNSMKDGLWRIVTGEDTAPGNEAERVKFDTRRDRALATVVLLYLSMKVVFLCLSLSV